MPNYPRCFAGLGGIAWVVRFQHAKPEVWGWSRASGFQDQLGMSEQWSEGQLELSREELVGIVPPPPEPADEEDPPVVPEPVVTLPEPRRRHVDLTNNG